MIGPPAWRWATGNFGVVEPGRVYRSAQLSAATLSRMIEHHQIRTVLNLRGPNPETRWYPDERSAVLEAGATYVDIPLASDYWLTPEQARTLLETLDAFDRPLLIHCQMGAERTGLVSAMVTLLREGSTLTEAERQFSPYYLFLPTEDGRIMRGHLRRYEGWLSAARLSHTPGRFRRWLLTAYRPGVPNRSLWPFDPYPFRVVYRPEAAEDVRRPPVVESRSEHD